MRLESGSIHLLPLTYTRVMVIFPHAPTRVWVQWAMHGGVSRRVTLVRVLTVR